LHQPFNFSFALWTPSSLSSSSSSCCSFSGAFSSSFFLSSHSEESEGFDDEGVEADDTGATTDVDEDEEAEVEVEMAVELEAGRATLSDFWSVNPAIPIVELTCSVLHFNPKLSARRPKTSQFPKGSTILPLVF